MSNIDNRSILIMKPEQKTNSKSSHWLPKNNLTLEKIPDNLLAIISGGTLDAPGDDLIWEIEGDTV